MFSLAGRLPSEPSADGLPSLFGALRRYFATVRLPANVHAGLLVHAPSPAGPLSSLLGRCQGLRPRRVQWMLAISHPPVLPSAKENCVGTLISEHFAAQWLACMCLCQRFTCSLATARARLDG